MSTKKKKLILRRGYRESTRVVLDTFSDADWIIIIYIYIYIYKLFLVKRQKNKYLKMIKSKNESEFGISSFISYI